jgi:molybdopterin-guanine dinucleotide biosynthesis protein A
MRSAVVLANAAEQSDSGPSLDGTVERVAPAVDEVVVACRDEQRDAVAAALPETDYRVAVDPVPDGGPVADIRSGCRVARGRRTFVTTCETRFVGPDLVTRLFESVEGDGAVPRIDGTVRPLAAVYDTDAVIAAAETTLGMGSTSLTDLLDRLTVATPSARAATRGPTPSGGDSASP